MARNEPSSLHTFCHFDSICCGSYSLNLSSSSFLLGNLDSARFRSRDFSLRSLLSPRLKSVTGSVCRTHAAHQLPKNGHISAVVAGFVDRRFENERAAREQRMIQNPLKRLQPDFALPHMLVAIHARAEQRLRIV